MVHIPEFTLRNCRQITHSGVKALIDSSIYKNVEQLDMQNTRLNAFSIKQITNKFPKLTMLNVSFCDEIPEKAFVECFGQSLELTSLQSLVVQGTLFSDQAIFALSA